MAVFFNGRLLITPVTASMVDDNEMRDQNLSVGNILAIVGRSEGGEPAKVLRFGSPTEARNVLRSGESLKAIEMAFTPSSETDGPQEIVFVRVNPATQSTLLLKDSGLNDVISLASQDYGLYTTGVRVKIETGTLYGKKVSTAFGNDYYSQDNIIRNCFSVQYTGSNETATIGVTASSVVLTDSAPHTIDLTAVESVVDLVDRINNIADYTAAVLDGNDEKPVLQALEGVTAQDCKAAPFTVTGTLQEIIDWFNAAGEGFITATRSAGALLLPSNIDWTYLAGGTDGVVTNTQWQSAFDVLQTADVQWVVPISDSDSIHAMTDAHVAYMSVVARMERRCFVGGTTGLTDAQAIAAAKNLNSDRTAYCHLGIYDYNTAGRLTLYPPYILAALVGGLFSGVNPGTAATNKTIKVRGLERDLRNPTDTDQLLLGGVLCPENTEDGYKIVQSITTWLVNNNYNRREVSVGAAVDFVSRNVRKSLDVLRGKKAIPLLLTEAISITDTQLKELSRPEPMGPAVLIGDALNPAYKNIVASIEGDVLRVEFQCSPVLPLNYILIVLHCKPWSGTATANNITQGII